MNKVRSVEMVLCISIKIHTWCSHFFYSNERSSIFGFLKIMNVLMGGNFFIRGGIFFFFMPKINFHETSFPMSVIRVTC